MDPRWVSATIKDGMDDHHIPVDEVVDREWKSLGECPMIGRMSDSVDSAEDAKRLDVGIETSEEVATQPGFPGFVEVMPGDEIVSRRIEDP